jgi:hypothetical protein
MKTVKTAIFFTPFSQMKEWITQHEVQGMDAKAKYILKLQWGLQRNSLLLRFREM